MAGSFDPSGQIPLPFFAADENRAEEEAVETGSFILSLRARGIRNTALLRAMELIPREVFAPRRFADLARTDVALPLSCGQTMTAPGSVATMLGALTVAPGQHILEIGTGSGYVTALLASLGAQVHSVERFNTLAESAIQHLRIVELGAQARVEIADGLAPRPRERFDRIVLNGAVSEIPAHLPAMLAPGGRLVGAFAGDGQAHMLQLDRAGDGSFSQVIGPRLRLAALVPGIAATL